MAEEETAENEGQRDLETEKLMLLRALWLVVAKHGKKSEVNGNKGMEIRIPLEEWMATDENCVLKTIQDKTTTDLVIMAMREEGGEE